jgi:hypothetical protein
MKRRNGSLTAANLGFLDRRSYFNIQVASVLLSRGRVGPVPDPLFSENAVVSGIELGTSRSAARNSEHYTTEAVKAVMFNHHHHHHHHHHHWHDSPL